MSLLEVNDLVVDFGRHRRVAVDHVSWSLDPGERLGLIGESGSGKSVTALAIMGLLPDNAHISGSIRWRGQEFIGASDRAMSSLRGSSIGMVFQEPMTALDPTMKVGRQVGEVALLHRTVARGQARSRVLEMLDEVGIEDPVRVADSYPHQLSGGQRQRALLAMALINSPDLLVCDEPTTALDVTVQARVLATIDEVLTSVGAACVFITHDLAVVSQICHNLIVMTSGKIVETGSTRKVLSDPKHPYTRRLLRAARLDLVEPGATIMLEDS
ncbi:ABC transporter ATP-binding protein [Cutibacterium sp.]|uniref:ATP-binding cassette domain-containing protein n=1 Tax=Cutibacterium sp. TaxID=1912221 RepID=UPI0026DB3494|nr:ABC transporter ATP-binding protein [Cutibacterium sp.]MDO4412060.1 ABC transporter ATP-binding protein [Cutibacterium sp.]